MNKRSVLRTIVIAVLFTLLMSINVFAAKWGAQINATKAWKSTQISSAPDSIMMHKLVVPEDAMVYISGVEDYYSSYAEKTYHYGMNLTLMTSGSVILGNNVYVNASSDSIKSYALKKGVYCIKVMNLDDYQILVKYAPVRDQGNTVKKKKGTNLKKKATMTALFGAADKSSKTEWFKFKLKKPKKVTLTAGAYGDASYRVTFYGPKPYKKGDTFYVSSGYKKSYKYWIQKGRKKLKLKKGTYYIRIQRSNNASGYCSIMWK